MGMRMQELAERSGLPRTTIHHYLREGLLPRARKTAPNAAEYDEAHLERLALIGRLRTEEFGALSIPQIRKVIGHVEGGVAPPAAVRLVEEDVEPVGRARIDPAELGDGSGLTTDFLRALERADIVQADPEGRYSPADVLVARACHAVCAPGGIEPADLGPLADLIRAVGDYSDTLVEVHSARASRPEAGLESGLASLCDALLWRAFGAE